MNSTDRERNSRFSNEGQGPGVGAPPVVVRPWAVALSLLLLIAPGARGELPFTPPQILPGDAVIGSAAGMQVEADVALAGNQYLVVWSDGRTTPDDYEPFATEGSGTDVYAIRLDDTGNPIGAGPIVVNQGVGDQIEPRVAWNGESWLVIWRQSTLTLPLYEQILAARVGADGTVLDAQPIVVHDNQSYYTDAVVEGGNGEWVVLFQNNGVTDGIRAVRVAGDGTVVNPGGLAIHNTYFLMDFDLAFAQNQYLIVWAGPFDAPRGARYTADLQPIGTSILPFARRVTSDGTDFLVVNASGPPPGATVRAVVVSAGGIVGPPATLFTGGNQDGTHGADAVWDGTYYWVAWNGNRMGRVSSGGQVLDPGGFLVTPATVPVSLPELAAVPTGGVQIVYNDGVSGADYPKDVYTGRVSPQRIFGAEALVSRGAPAQLEADFATGDTVNLVVFLSRTSDAGRILAHRIDDQGAAIDAEPIEVATGPLPGLGVPTLGAPAAAWNGSVFLITWSDGLQIFARRMHPDGTFLDASPLTVMDGHDPDVDAVGQVFLVAGLDFLLDNPQWQATHTMRVDGATGANLDAQPNALGGFLIYARHPRVVSWNDRWLVVWQRNISHDDPAAGTTAAIVMADGTTPGTIEVPLGWRPDAAVSGDRALLVAVTNTIASATTDLAGHLMGADGTLIGTTFTISSAADKQLRPAVAWNGTDFIVAWEDKRNAVIYYDERTDIYGTRVATDGTVIDPAGVPLAASTVPEGRPALASVGEVTLLAASSFRADPELAAYRIGIQRNGGAVTAAPEVLASGESAIRLLGAQPNPSRAATTIRFRIAEAAPVTVQVFDVRGRLLRTLADRRAMPSDGVAGAPWDGRDADGRAVGSGVFLYRVQTPNGAVSGKMVRRR